MAGVGASMGAMQSLLERGRRGKGKRRQGRGVGGRHGEREGLLGATPCSWLLYVCSDSYVRRRKQQEGEEKKENRRNL
jgi:hypothetical protein